MKSTRFLTTLAFISIAVGSSACQQSAAAPLFEVVSIRQVDPNAVRSDGRPDVEITANGWRLNDGPLFAAIINAYTPSAGAGFYTLKQVQGLPGWARDEQYVIDAKIEESDIARWHDSPVQGDLLHAMMRSMLAERCKLLVHRESKEVPIYLLILKKDGPTFKEAVPGVPHPPAGAISGGGEFLSSDGNGVMHFYGAPLTAVAGVLSNITGRTVQDATGLTGRYDVALKRPSIASSSDTDTQLSVSAAVGDLGLQLVPAKGNVEILVIDHIERPSGN